MDLELGPLVYEGGLLLVPGLSMEIDGDRCSTTKGVASSTEDGSMV